MIAPLVAVLVWADRKLDAEELGGTVVPGALRGMVLGAEAANREFD
jgi:hypothetical protein